MSTVDTSTWGPADWEGYARQATARQTAGVPLNDLDRRALDMYPDPAMVGEPGYGGNR